MVVFSDLTIGHMLAVFGYLWFMMGPVQEILSIQYAYYAADAAVSRLNTLFSMKNEVAYPAEKNPFIPHQAASIELKNLRFHYNESQQVLDGVTLSIKSGEKVAFVGASGAGKSTLVSVLLGLYPIESGDILFDRIPVEQIGWDAVRENVATVLQSPALFNDTVRENVAMGREFSDEQVWHALDIAQLKQTVHAMPEQLDTLVGRFGLKLSGGQRQRLAVARMVLIDPSIVILDEATSALDSETEMLLHEALAEYLEGRTTIIIAHRLSAVRQADRVVVFDGGKIIAQGTHEQLISDSFLYKQLYAQQVG